VGARGRRARGLALLTIRPYRAEDRARVREIAYLTGYMGESPAWYWRDAKSFAEIWSGYYTDREPESAFVAVEAGEVVGYLLGCVDTARAPSPREEIVRQLRKRWLLVRPGTAGFFWRSLRDTLRDGEVPSGELRDPRWPAHLHINLLPAARGLGAGRGLVEAWLARLRSVGAPGCHLGTLAENTNAIAFFERMGFERFGGPALVPGMRLRTGGRMHAQLMVRSL
jgi:ribosomal protein S18 acetylase RimI-like enzyme